MKWRLSFLFICIIGCKTEVETPCGTLRCPVNTKSISISTIDAFKKPLKAAYIESYNYRTGIKNTNLQDRPHIINFKAYKYSVFENPRAFSTKGDAVSLYIRSESGKETTTNYKIAGGECACEVIKISGPEVIQIK
jgi:hypothetical protein